MLSNKLNCILTALLIVFLISACGGGAEADKIPTTLGVYDSKQIWTHGGFRDYTDFGIYSYSSVTPDQSQYFESVSDTDADTIISFVDNFEEWVAVFRSNDPEDALVLNYAFDRSIIDTSDYFYIYESKDYPKFGCYDVWFFDTQTMTLYYFHNNI